jgi:hypothetical protein
MGFLSIAFKIFKVFVEISVLLYCDEQIFQGFIFMSHKSWIMVSGFFWAIVGFFLLYKGLHLIAEGSLGVMRDQSFAVSLFGSPEKGAMGLVAIGLFVGFIKGRFVLAKTVRRVCTRIVGLTLPISIKEVYSISYLLLIASMIFLGISLRLVPISLEIKGVVDVAIGSALLNGAMLYFRASQALKISHL